MTDCWTSDPSLRPGFDKIVITMSGYMSNVDKQSYDARSRSRLDSGIGMVDGGYVDMLHTVSTPSTGTGTGTGTTSKSSTRSDKL